MKAIKHKISATALLFFAAAVVHGQTLISDTDQSALDVTAPSANTIFVHGSSGFTLTSTTDDGAGVDYTEIHWSIETDGGGYDGLYPGTTQPDHATVSFSGTLGSVMTVTNLAPGYYTFIATGIAGTVNCDSDPEEFTVFVLAPISITASLTGAIQEYCAEDDISSFGPITATASYDSTVDHNDQNSRSMPALGDFELQYDWYKMPASATPVFNVATAEHLVTQTPASNTTESTYSFTDANDKDLGTWNYFVTVTYTVKTGMDENVIVGGATPTVITVTPKPGKPTISIQSI